MDIKDKRVFDSSRPLKRSAGENIGGTFTSMHRVERLLVIELTDQVNMIDRCLEVMAAENNNILQSIDRGDI